MAARFIAPRTSVAARFIAPCTSVAARFIAPCTSVAAHAENCPGTTLEKEASVDDLVITNKEPSMLVRALALSSLVAASAHAAVGFSMSGELGDHTTVHVSRPTPGAVRLVVNFEPFPSPISNDPGCGVRLTPAEASHLGELFIWAASEWAPHAFYKEVPMRYGGEIRVERSPTMAIMEVALDDGTDLLGLSLDCVFSMDDDDAEMVGSWLYTAANP